MKLMAGDVAKIVAKQPRPQMTRAAMAMDMAEMGQVTEKAFDEFHLYSLWISALLKRTKGWLRQ